MGGGYRRVGGRKRMERKRGIFDRMNKIYRMRG
jgi:hypothetical protein